MKQQSENNTSPRDLDNKNKKDSDILVEEALKYFKYLNKGYSVEQARNEMTKVSFFVRLKTSLLNMYDMINSMIDKIFDKLMDLLVSDFDVPKQNSVKQHITNDEYFAPKDVKLRYKTLNLDQLPKAGDLCRFILYDTPTTGTFPTNTNFVSQFKCKLCIYLELEQRNNAASTDYRITVNKTGWFNVFSIKDNRVIRLYFGQIDDIEVLSSIQDSYE